MAKNKPIKAVDIPALIKAKESSIKLSDKDIFGSGAFRAYCNNMVAVMTRKYTRPPIVKVIYATPDKTAFTDSRYIVINPNCGLITKFSTRESRYAVLMGMLFHEVAHCNFGEFRATSSYLKDVEQGKFPVYEPSGVTDELREAFKGKYNMVFSKFYKDIENIVSDAHDEEKQMEASGYFVTECIMKARASLHVGEATLEDMIAFNEGYLTVGLMIAVLFQLIRFGELVAVHDETVAQIQPYLEPFIPLIKRAVNTDNAAERFIALNEMVVQLWPIMSQQAKRLKDEPETPPMPSQGSPDNGGKKKRGKASFTDDPSKATINREPTIDELMEAIDNASKGVGSMPTQGRHNSSAVPPQSQPPMPQGSQQSSQSGSQNSSSNQQSGQSGSSGSKSNSSQSQNDNSGDKGQSGKDSSSSQEQGPSDGVKESGDETGGGNHSESSKDETSSLNGKDDGGDNSQGQGSPDDSEKSGDETGNNSKADGTGEKDDAAQKQSSCGGSDGSSGDEKDETSSGGINGASDADDNTKEGGVSGSSREKDSSENGESGDSGSEKDSVNSSDSTNDGTSGNGDNQKDDAEKSGKPSGDQSKTSGSDSQGDEASGGSDADENSDKEGSKVDGSGDEHSSDEADNGASSGNSPKGEDAANEETSGADASQDGNDTDQQNGHDASADSDGEPLKRRNPEDPKQESTPEFNQEMEDAMRQLLQEISRELAEEAAADQMMDDRLIDIKNCDMNSTHKGKKLMVKRADDSEENESKYGDTYQEVSSYSSMLQRKMKEALRDLMEGGVTHHLQFGHRIEAQNGYRPDQRFYCNRKQPENLPEMAISVLLDNSGSMCGPRMEAGLKACVLLFDFCVSLGIPCMIAGHQVQYAGGVKYTVCTDFDKVSRRDKYRIMGMAPGGCNRDGMAIEISANQLAKRPETIKLLFVISDGQPNDDGYGGKEAADDIRSIVSKYRKKGIETFAVAIGDDKDKIRAIYGDGFIDISDLQKLPKMLTSVVKKRIMREIR